MLCMYQVSADPWFSLPTAVNDSDAYANNMAQYVAANLAPGATIKQPLCSTD